LPAIEAGGSDDGGVDDVMSMSNRCVASSYGAAEVEPASMTADESFRDSTYRLIEVIGVYDSSPCKILARKQ